MNFKFKFTSLEYKKPGQWAKELSEYWYKGKSCPDSEQNIATPSRCKHDVWLGDHCYQCEQENA